MISLNAIPMRKLPEDYLNRPKNRNYSCVYCGLFCHRDIVGAYNILTAYHYGALVPDDLFPYPKPKYLRIP